MFDANEHGPNDDINADSLKNPILSKRTLLDSDRSAYANKANGDLVGEAIVDADAQRLNEIDAGGRVETDDIRHVGAGAIDNGVNSSDKLILDKIKYAAGNEPNIKSSHAPTEGRVVVYGDSNCLDSTHIEKPCFWLLDTLLEYTMTSHVSTLLKDLNRAPTTQFDTTLKQMPKRLPNNNLHMYSKVLVPHISEDNGSDDGGATNRVYVKPAKRTDAICMPLQWAPPIFLNISAPMNSDQWNPANRDSSDADAINMVGDLSLRRKLESQKGEVRS